MSSVDKTKKRKDSSIIDSIRKYQKSDFYSEYNELNVYYQLLCANLNVEQKTDQVNLSTFENAINARQDIPFEDLFQLLLAGLQAQTRACDIQYGDVKEDDIRPSDETTAFHIYIKVTEKDLPYVEKYIAEFEQRTIQCFKHSYCIYLWQKIATLEPTSELILATMQRLGKIIYEKIVDALCNLSFYFHDAISLEIGYRDEQYSARQLEKDSSYVTKSELLSRRLASVDLKINLIWSYDFLIPYYKSVLVNKTEIEQSIKLSLERITMLITQLIEYQQKLKRIDNNAIILDQHASFYQVTDNTKYRKIPLLLEKGLIECIDLLIRTLTYVDHINPDIKKNWMKENVVFLNQYEMTFCHIQLKKPRSALESDVNYTYPSTALYMLSHIYQMRNANDGKCNMKCTFPTNSLPSFIKTIMRCLSDYDGMMPMDGFHPGSNFVFEFKDEPAHGVGVTMAWLNRSWEYLLDPQYNIFKSYRSVLFLNPIQEIKFTLLDCTASELMQFLHFFFYVALIKQFNLAKAISSTLWILLTEENPYKLLIKEWNTMIEEFDPIFYKSIQVIRKMSTEEYEAYYKMNTDMVDDKDVIPSYDVYIKDKCDAAGFPNIHQLLTDYMDICVDLTFKFFMVQDKNGFYVDLPWSNMLKRYLLTTPISIDVEDWIQHIRWDGPIRSETKDYMKQWLRDPNHTDMLQNLLLFVTNQKYAPEGGFKNLNPPFTISHEERNETLLPFASTCFHTLHIPVVSSYFELETQLHISLSNSENTTLFTSP